MIKKIFLHDHGFETVPSREPPDFNLWILSTALASIDAGEEHPFLEEAISIADRKRLPTLDEPFSPETLHDPATALTAAHVGSMLYRAREIAPWDRSEALRLAEEARVCTAGLSCGRGLKHDLVGFSMVVDANVLRLDRKFPEARETLARGARLLLAGTGSLDAAAHLFSRRGSLEWDGWDLQRAALASGYAARMYERLRLGTEAGCELVKWSGVLNDLCDFDAGLSCLDRAADWLPVGYCWALGIPSTRARLLSDLGLKDAARFELDMFQSLESRFPDRQAAATSWRVGIVERDAGSQARSREHLVRAVSGLRRLGDWENLAMALQDFAALERSAGCPEAMLERLNCLDEVVRRHNVPAKYLKLSRLQC